MTAHVTRFTWAVHGLSISDEGYPRSLRALTDPPARLRIAGDLPELQRAVAVVGTRAADPDAQAFARGLAASLVTRGCVVVSGGARGIDSAAHQGALEAGGTTLAVFAGGLNHPAPRSNAALFSAISRSGALLSELDDDIAPVPFGFLRRNRLIAALSQAVVVVQAPHRSGALSTARIAKRLNIPVLAVPASPWDLRGAGSFSLLRSGAKPCEGASDVLAALQAASPTGARSKARADRPPRERRSDRGSPAGAGLSPEQSRVLRAIGARPAHPDELVMGTGLGAETVLNVLLELELRQLVSARPGGRYVRVRGR